MSKKTASAFNRFFRREAAGPPSAPTPPSTLNNSLAAASQQTIDLYSTEGPIGIKVIADPAGATLDIVFVHGLTGNRDKTWTHTNGAFWPLQLADDIPDACIMTFGYDADVVKLWGIAGSNNLRNHGKNMASDVSDQRRAHRDRPIIFIAHSLGGLVCEQALLICREGDTNLDKLFHSTRGIIFMGTPHGGAGLATLGHRFAKYLNVIRHTNSSIVGVLQQKSEVLTAVQQQFQQLLHRPEVNISIYCFFEERAVVGVGLIVSEQSAVFSGYPNQAIAANHMDMTKFSGRNDVGYQRALNRVRDLVELINSTTAIDMEPAARAVPEPGFASNQTISSTSGTAIGIGSQRVEGGLHIHHESSQIDPRREKEIKCQQLLKTSDYERHKGRNPYPVKGTCQWFLHDPKYINWRDDLNSSLLWVSADPGCGKSVLSKFLADKELHTNKERTTCYFFFKDDNEAQKTATNALCALLHQLFCHKPELLSYAEKVRSPNGDKFTESVDLLWKILSTASTDPQAGEIICILDALDECKQSDLKYLLHKICSFYDGEGPCVSDKTTLKFLVTSRPLQPIADEFNVLTQKLPTIRLAGEEETDQIKLEIGLVIEDELAKLQHKWSLDQNTLCILREELAKVEHRTYLWLKLIFDLIWQDAQSVTKRGRQKIFRSIPDSVDAAYTAILNQSTDKAQARKLLQIVCTAIRPLSVKEMSIALSIEESDKAIDDLEVQTEKFSKDLIRNLCGLFVSVIDGRVYLLHQTAKEFLIGQRELAQSTAVTNWTWKHSLFVEHSNFVLAHICMWYLRLEGFSVEEACMDPQDNADDYTKEREILKMKKENLQSRYDFLNYAAINWAVHFREAMIPKGHNSIALALDIYSPQGYPYIIWGLIYWWNKTVSKSPSNISSLYLASQFGHQRVVSQLLAAPGIEINTTVSDGWTPLCIAASRGHADVVSQLLAAPGIEINIANSDGWTSLYAAAFRGHAHVVSQLLTTPGIEINTTVSNGQTPLCVAASEGHVDVVSQLLAAPGIEINIANSDGWTSLYAAASEGHAHVVSQLLAAPGIEINTTVSNGQTPLYVAASRGHADVVSQLLTTPGIEINTADSDGWTPLCVAASEGHVDVVSQLLAASRIEINMAVSNGQTPLCVAASEGHVDVVSQLLAASGIEINIANSGGWTSFYAAASEGHAHVVSQLLAASGIEINTADSGGWTPFCVAASEGHADVVSQLLAASRIEINIALYVAASRGHANVVSQLLTTPGIEINTTVSNGQTPLCVAASEGHVDVVSQLLAAPGIEINIANSDGWTSLYAAASEGHAHVVSQLLAAPGIEINTTVSNGQTPLYVAASRGHADVVSQLLTTPGIEINTADSDGWTPLCVAASEGHVDVVSQLLAASRIEINMADSDGWTPLYVAASEGHADVVSQLLAARGINVDLTDHLGQTPLCIAQEKGFKNIVKLLLPLTSVSS